MKPLLIILTAWLTATIAFAQPPTTIVPGTPVTSATMNANFLGLYNGRVGRWSGAGAPGSVAYSITGDLYFNTASPGQVYGCYRTPCTAVGSNNWVLVSTGGGSSALSAITAATGSNTIANGDYPQLWNWASTTSGRVGITFGETTASTSAGSPYTVQIKTATGSTAIPLNVLNSLSGSQTLPALSITPTWNTTGVVDAALLVNPTNTASGTGSLLMDLQLGGVSQFSVDKAGNALAAGTMTSGNGSGIAGSHDFAAGTAAAVPANSFGWGAPATMTTSQRIISPNAVPAAHSVMVIGAPSSNVSSFTYKAVPDCTDSGGNHLNFTQSSDAFSCGTSGGGSGFATPGSSHTFAGNADIFVCTTTCTITVPVPAAGLQYCVMNDDNVSTVITLSAIGSSARYESTARTAYGTAGTGTFVSGGAVGNMVCIIGRDSTHYLTASYEGTWTAN